MQDVLDRDRVATAATSATSAAGSVAGATADPRAGWSRLKSRLTSPRLLATGAGLVLAYLAGRRRGRGRRHR